MKRNIALVLILVFALAFSACGKKTATSEKLPNTDVSVEKEEDIKTPEENINEENGAEEEKIEEKPAEKPAQKPEEKPQETPEEKPEEKPSKPQGDTRPLATIMASITSGLGEMPALGEIALDEENFSFYTFADFISGAEGLVSEPLMGSFAHSVVLVRLPEGADVNSFASKVKSNADPRKWICVEAEKVTVSTKGNLVLLVMSSAENADKITSNFLK